jgi:alkanesulfonate monooxygenase SsuD/methylene tetrahydromethanopterin reductase-like flavin-dependent oxidoreductase (luciferase family)
MDYGLPIQFGVFVIPDATDPMRPVDAAIQADDLGFELIGVQDHPYQRRFYDAWTLLTAIAMRTKRVSVFTDVANLPLRPPAVMAKVAASLDLLSGGRAELGLGTGSFGDAIKSIGGLVRTPGEAVSALEEAIHVIRLMWSGERNVHFDGRFYTLAGVNTGPVPAHRIGIWLGAYRPRMLGLVGRLADGWVPSMGYLKPSDMPESNARIDDAAAAAGRKPSEIRRVLNIGQDINAEEFATLAIEHGFDTFMVSQDLAEYIAKEIGPRVRELVAASRGSR